MTLAKQNMINNFKHIINIKFYIYIYKSVTFLIIFLSFSIAVEDELSITRQGQ